MAIIRRNFNRSSESTGAVRLIQTGLAWATTPIPDGTWDIVNNLYYFTIDTDVALQYDPTKTYRIEEGDGNVVLSLLMIGDLEATEDLAAHEAADNNIHGLGGAASNKVVGTEESQTLTVKVIDADGNTITNLTGEQFKAIVEGKDVKAVKIKPNAGADAVLHVDTASVAAGVTMQAASADKSTDRDLRIIAKKIDLSDRSAGNIVVVGLDEATGTTEAVRWDEFDVVKTRLDALEAGGIWAAPPPDVILDLNRYGRWAINTHFQVNISERGNVARYVIYWNNAGYGNISAGSISEGAIDSIARRSVGNTRVIGGQGNDIFIQTAESISVVVVAYDQAGTAFSSSEQFAEPFGIRIPQRDGAGEIIAFENQSTSVISRAGSASSAVATA